MVVTPGSLEVASPPSPRLCEAGEGLRPVKAVLWVLAAALRDLKRAIKDDEEKGN